MAQAKRLSGIQESFIREMTRLALKHKSINLAQGYPDFDPPAEVLAAAHRALDEGLNQYSVTWGMPALRRAIAVKIRRLYGLEFDPDEQITVTCGVTEAIAITLMSQVNPGDEVIILEPFHEGYVPAVIFAGAIPRFVPLHRPNYALDLDELKAAINDQTRAIIINTPHNPTGHVFTQEELAGIADLCQEHDLLAITDEIYEHILYDGRSHIPLATLPDMAERTITIGGFSKTFAITGWRVGYACAPVPQSKALRTVHDYTTICAPAPLQAACVAALALPDSYYQGMLDDYTKRRATMMAILREANFKAREPKGAYYVMADFSEWVFEGDDFAFARWLPTEAGVSVVPGSSFYGTLGLGATEVRFAFAKRLDTLAAAGDRLRASRDG